MRLLSLAAAALLCAAPVVAQTTKTTSPPKLAPCDTAGYFVKHMTPIYNAGIPTLTTACPAFQKLSTDFAALNPQYADAIALLLHGAIPKPPTPVDTTTIPPRDTTKAPPVDTTATAPVATWTFCTNAGAMCNYAGLRVVQLCDATETRCVQQTAYHTVPCAGYGFNNQYPSPTALHCRIGPPITESIASSVMGPILSSPITVFKGAPGSSTQDVQSGGGNGSVTDGSGSFRTTCSFVKARAIDPLVFPGQSNASHLHIFFGNTAIDENTTSATIASTGNSSCRGGILNRTAYWTPAVWDTKTNAMVLPDEGTFYYKTGYNMLPSATQPMPTGLHMIAGDKNATDWQRAPGPLNIAAWDCINPATLNSVAGFPTSSTIPATCPVAMIVRLTVIFPQCWDGKNLDAPDHQSHMAYPNYSSSGKYTSKCPADHPVQLPELSEHFDFSVPLGASPATWMLASDMIPGKPGISAHADWIMGWDPPTMLSLTQNCLQRGVDCGVGGIGANRSLY